MAPPGCGPTVAPATAAGWAGSEAVCVMRALWVATGAVDDAPKDNPPDEITTVSIGGGCTAICCPDPAKGPETGSTRFWLIRSRNTCSAVIAAVAGPGVGGMAGGVGTMPWPARAEPAVVLPGAGAMVGGGAIGA